MKRCVNRKVIDFIKGALIAVGIFIVIAILGLLTIGEVSLIIPDGSLNYQFTDFMKLFNIVAVVYIGWKIPNILNYLFPKC